jgi:hypothetical protein
MIPLLPYTNLVFLVGIRLVFLGIYRTDTGGKLDLCLHSIPPYIPQLAKYRAIKVRTKH